MDFNYLIPNRYPYYRLGKILILIDNKSEALKK